MKLPDNIRYMAVEGVLGVGKTTLVRHLANHIQCRALLEDYANNPFLQQFYKNPEKFAFQTQIVFLLSRHKQIRETFEQQDLFSQQIISDYMFDKDKIFASLNLDENEISLYHKLLPFLEKDLTKPDYVVYLQASTEILLERIRFRDRPFERNIDRKYIDALNDCYNSFFMHYTDTSLLIINTNDIDFVKNTEDFELILTNICKAPQGINYLSPMGPH